MSVNSEFDCLIMAKRGHKMEYLSHLSQTAKRAMSSNFTERFKALTDELDRGWKVDLARRCGVSRPTVTHWRSGRTHSADPVQLFAIADYFGVNARWLATGEGPKWLEVADSTAEVSTGGPLATKGDTP
ncbi:helix-turn-helix domain-containing protein [Variovorax sp. PAMC26660]|uniref:helix-turn-helix domain-containing protein n=1 Tax=Variovorax sp. PAMC26660 TaxID=2762322 RepID=UPI00164D0E31|nr:helix-turn-helix transcriptional regulator [Variovorax sp. PAMC26660]QNK67185.1 helix-turn-helix domain-containing protein [Variovorax sp. PAMC26660]